MRHLASIALCTILAACGGGGGEETTVTILNQTVTASGAPSGGSAGQSQWLIGVDGPALVIDRAASVTVCAQGEWVQSLNADTSIFSDIAMALPGDQPSGGTVTTAGTGSSATIPFSRCYTLETTGPTTRQTRMTFHIRVGSGPSNSLGAYSARVAWTATATY